MALACDRLVLVWFWQKVKGQIAPWCVIYN